MEDYIYMWSIIAGIETYFTDSNSIEENYDDLDEALEAYSTLIERRTEELDELDCWCSCEEGVFIAFYFRVLKDIGNEMYECVFERIISPEHQYPNVVIDDEVLGETSLWAEEQVREFEARDYHEL